MQKSDRELVERCVQKDPLAWAELVRKYSLLISISIEKRLNRCGSHFVKSDIDEIRQEVLLSIWRGEKLKAIRNRDAISYWLAIVSGNVAMDWIRRKKGRELPASPLIEMAGEAGVKQLAGMRLSKGSNPYKDAHENEISEIIRKAMAALNERERLIAKLSLYFDKNNHSIAKMLGMPRGTVASTLKRSKEKLKARIAKIIATD